MDFTGNVIQGFHQIIGNLPVYPPVTLSKVPSWIQKRNSFRDFSRDSFSNCTRKFFKNPLGLSLRIRIKNPLHNVRIPPEVFPWNSSRIRSGYSPGFGKPPKILADILIGIPLEIISETPSIYVSESFTRNSKNPPEVLPENFEKNTPVILPRCSPMIPLRISQGIRPLIHIKIPLVSLSTYK